MSKKSVPADAPKDGRDRVCEKRWQGALTTDWFGRPLFVYTELSSTMDKALELAQDRAHEGALVVALQQTKGRGRLGREWVSGEGGLFFSCILRPPLHKNAQDTAQIALAAGLAAGECVRDFSGKHPWIRWPNDVLLDGRKIAGILVEAQQQSVILGVGINVLQTGNVPDDAAVLSRFAEEPLALESVLNAFGNRFETWYRLWLAEGFEPLHRALRFWMHGVGEPVRVTVGKTVYEGQGLGVDESGRFLMRMDSGAQRAFEQGEVTLLRPLSGDKR